MQFQELIKDENYMEAFSAIWVFISEKEFKQNPNWILDWILILLAWEQKEGEKKIQEQEAFTPAFYDSLARRYWKTPIEIMQSFTYSQLDAINAGIEYNMNIENNKKWKNAKFYAKVDVFKYDDVIERVREARRKMEEKKS
jgi:hypothetical protein